jgi:FkbM family methyltransferase
MQKTIVLDVGSFSFGEIAGALDRSKEKIIELCRADELEIYSIEPHPEFFAKLQTETKGVPNIHLFDIALSDYCGRNSVYLSNGGYTSLNRYLNKHPRWGRREEGESHEVDVITLEKFIEDNHIPYISRLHIDAQGEDFRILKGLGRFCDIVQMGRVEVIVIPLYENHSKPEEMEAWLIEKGFEIEKGPFDYKNRFQDWRFRRRGPSE